MSEQSKLFQRALTKLDPENLEAGLPGREAHAKQLYNFIYQRLKIRKTGDAKRAKVESGEVARIRGTHDNKTMFVCGVPGTGKTVTVMRVLDDLEKLMNRRGADIHKFKRAYINGQHLQYPDRVYCEMLSQFRGENHSVDMAQELLESIFIPKHSSSETNLFYIAVIDELDVLYSARRNSLFYNLFNWPLSSNSRLILIVIANAMDLSERFMRGRIQSRMGWEKLLFESYNADSLVKIVETRLGEDLLKKCIDEKALKIGTARVARSTGDARRILDLCRLAIDRAMKNKNNSVSAALMNQIATENLDSFKVKHLKRCSLLQLYILKAVLAESDSVSEDNVIARNVYTQLCKLLEINNCFPGLDYLPGSEDFENALNSLAAESIIHIESSKPLMNKHLFIKDNSNEYKELIRNTTTK